MSESVSNRSREGTGWGEARRRQMATSPVARGVLSQREVF